MKYISTLALIAVLVPTMASAVTTTGSATADAKIVAPLTVSEQFPLNFGTITNDGSTVSVDPSGQRSDNDANTLVSDPGNEHRQGTMVVTGPQYLPYSVTFPASVTLTGTGTAAGSTMTASVGDDGNEHDIGASGQDGIDIGGELTVGSNQAAGPYHGSYTITISY